MGVAAKYVNQIPVFFGVNRYECRAEIVLIRTSFAQLTAVNCCCISLRSSMVNLANSAATEAILLRTRRPAVRY